MLVLVGGLGGDVIGRSRWRDAVEVSQRAGHDLARGDVVLDLTSLQTDHPAEAVGRKLPRDQ